MSIKIRDLSFGTGHIWAGILLAFIYFVPFSQTVHAATPDLNSDYLAYAAHTEQTVQQCPTTIAYNDIIECSFAPSDQTLIYNFTGNKDDRVHLIFFNDALPAPDVTIEVRNVSDGEVVNFFTCKTVSGAGLLLLDKCLLPEDGSYQLWVSADDGDGAAFRFMMRRHRDLPQFPEVKYGETATGSVTSEFGIGIHPFAGKKNDIVQFILKNDTSQTADAHMEIRQVQNGEVVNFFTCRIQTSAAIKHITNCILPEDGSYQLWVYEPGYTDPIEYHFKLDNPFDSPVNADVVYGTTTTGTIASEFEIDIHPFEGERNDRVQVILRKDTNENTQVTAEIRQVWNGDVVNHFTCKKFSRDSVILIDNCPLPEDGSYQLWIHDSEFAAPIDYHFQMESLFDLPVHPEIGYGDRVPGAVASEFEIGIHPFEGQKDERIQVIVNDGIGAGSFVEVRQAWDGEVVNFFSCRQGYRADELLIENCQLPETGSYQIWVYKEGYSENFNYAVCLTTPGAGCVDTSPATPTSATPTPATPTPATPTPATPTPVPTDNTPTPTATPTATPESPAPTGAKPLVLIYGVLDNNLGDIPGTWERLVNNAEAGAHGGINVMLLIDGPGTEDSYVYALESDGDEFCPNLRNPTCNGRYVEGQNLWAWDEDSAHPESLLSFAAKASELYPDSSTVILSLVGHGSGWSANYLPGQPSGWADQAEQRIGGMLWDDTPGNDGTSRSMSTRMLGYVLGKVSEELGQKIDLLYLDACSMGMAEVAYELRESATYLLASANTAWSSFAYDDLLAATDADDSAKAIGLDWLAAEANVLEKNDYPFTLSLLDLTRMNELASAVTLLGDALTAQLDERQELIQLAYEQSERFESDYNGAIDDNEDTYVDLVSLTKRLEEQFSTESDLLSALTSVQNAVSGVIINWQLGRGNPWLYPDAEWSWAESSGLSIYVPLNQDEGKRALYTDENLAWAADTTWDEFLDAAWGGGIQAASIGGGAISGGAINENSSAVNELPTCESTRNCDGLAAQLEVEEDFVQKNALVFLPVMQK